MAPRGRPRAFDRDAALTAAMELFWRKGYSATSVADLCAAMSINAPSLYAAFGSKENLYGAAIERYAAVASPAIWGRLDEKPTAREAVADMLMASAAALPGRTTPAGWMVTLSSVGQEGEERLGAQVAEARAAGRKMIEARIARAVAEGELLPGIDAEEIARYFTCVQQGMSILARDGADRAQLEGVARAAMQAWPGLTRPKETSPAPPAPRGQ